MYFYVFLQPEIFSEAAAEGEDAVQNVLAILTGLIQNCFLTVFEDNRWEGFVKEKLEAWPETMTRKRVKSILTHFKKRNRFLYCITPDYMEEKLDLDCVFEQATSIQLDLILITSTEENRSEPTGVEMSTRREYQSTAFEPKRSEIAVSGKTCRPGEMEAFPFMEYHFAKALRHAMTIQICDRMCGKHNFADNFRYTTEQFMVWLGNILSDPEHCKIVFHMGLPTGEGKNFLLEELASFKRISLSKTIIEVHFYEESFPNPSLPHQRFIVTDQVALNIERGLDFLNRRTKKCRDTHVNYQDPIEARNLLESYSLGCISKDMV